MEIQESGCVIVSKKEFLTWCRCPQCKLITYALFPNKALNVDPTCIRCGHFIRGATIPNITDRERALGHRLSIIVDKRKVLHG